jgi:hypothetical protein
MRRICVALAIPALAVVCGAQVEARYISGSRLPVATGIGGTLLLNPTELVFSSSAGQFSISYEHVLSLRLDRPFRRFDAAAQIGGGKVPLPGKDAFQYLTIAFEDTQGYIVTLVLEIGSGTVPYAVKTLQSLSRMSVLKVSPENRPELLFKALTFDAPAAPDLAHINPAQQFSSQASAMPRAIFWGVGLQW